MKCYYHPRIEHISKCTKCGKPLCKKCERMLKQNYLVILWKDVPYCPFCFEKQVQKKVKTWRENMGYSEKDRSQVTEESEFSY